MGVSNVTNTNNANLVKLALKKKQEKTVQEKKPDYLQMTGSIFGAPQANKNSTVNKTETSLTKLNTSKTISDLRQNSKASYLSKDGSIFNAPKAAVTQASSSAAKKEEPQASNAADGKAAAANAEKQTSEAKKLTSQTQDNTKTVQKFDKEAKNLEKKMKKDNKTFEKKLKQQEEQIKENNIKLEKLTRESEQTQTEIDNAQNELDSLLAANSFSMQNGKGSQNSEKIKELQAFIGTKTNLVQANGRQIYSISRSSSRTMKQMDRLSRNYQKTSIRNKKNIQSNQNETNKVIKTAEKIDFIMQATKQVGQLSQYLGQGLQALGQAMSSNPYTAAVGAVLISVGTVTEKVGKVTEMVGDYGSCAANITKTAAYAADGNLMGAMTSAASAIQLGASAANSTKNLSKSFNAIDKQAQQASQKLTADTVSKQTVKNLSEEELGGMTKKEARKAISADLQKQMQDGTIKATGDSTKDKVKNLTQQLTQTKDGSSIATKSLDNAKKTFSDNLAKNDIKFESGKFVDKTGKKVSRKTLRAAKSQFSNKAAANTVKSSQKFDFKKLQQFGNGLMAMAAMFEAQNSQQPEKGHLEQWDLSQNRRYQKIQRSRMSNLQYASYI